MRLTFFLSDRLPDISSNGSLSVTPWLEYTPCLQGCSMGQIWGTEYLILIFSYYVYVSYSYQFRYFWKDSPDTLYKFIVIVYCDVYLFCKFAYFQIDEFAESTVNSSFSLYMYTVYCICICLLFILQSEGWNCFKFYQLLSLKLQGTCLCKRPEKN